MLQVKSSGKRVDDTEHADMFEQSKFNSEHVNTIHPAPEIHEHFMIQKRLRNIVYIFMHNLDNPGTTVTNYVNVMTHTETTEHDARRV